MLQNRFPGYDSWIFWALGSKRSDFLCAAEAGLMMQHLLLSFQPFVTIDRTGEIAELWLPPSLFSTYVPPGNLLPPPNLSSTARGDELPPYSNLASSPPPPPLSPPPIANKKRRQARTPSLSPSSSTPNYRTWKHLDLACGEREKIMYKLLRRMAKKEKSITDLMNNMEAKEAVVDKKITSLTLLLAQVQEKEAALREAGGMQSVDQGRGRVQEHGASEDASTAPPTPSGGLVSTASVSSNISDRVQTHVAAQIDRLREEIACEYATSDEVDLLLSGYVDDDQMFEAIRDAVDEAMAGIRARMMEALE
ncbi:hypothetical protein F5883DRAFT_698628 [Diaporthe sp. PMI_573]|nr:hypothetical protein F5883DRAFT_698628 [Diaporthaceae sp. PMI_573]